jgi:DNA (cytosine-5)-methyltransferase 1
MRVGSLFTGYGGLDMAVGGDLAWYSEIEPAACKVLSAHHDAPNLGDIKKIDWTTVAPVDVITGGYPCQPFSHAGLRKGENDERHLWPYIREGISVLRPRLVLLENVRGHVTLGLREVLGEIAELGYGARWGVVRASDAGAPHQRARVFIAAYGESNGGDERPDGFDSSHGAGSWLQVATGGSDSTATDTDSGGHGEQQDSRRVGSVEGNTEGEASERQRSRSESASGVDWGQYGYAIARWERVTGRKAPAPTVNNGRTRLNPAMVEWMMGLPDGWVTGHDLTPTQELKMLGNGVVPQQARLAIQLLERMGK